MLIKKILRSLPSKFTNKILSLEGRDTDNMSTDELIGSLETFELFYDRMQQRDAEQQPNSLRNLAF